MGYKPENTIRGYRRELHGELLAASAPVPKRSSFHATLAFFVPPFLLGLALAQGGMYMLAPPEETYRAAAPEGYVDDEKDIDDIEVTEFVCEELCLPEADETVEFIRAFCNDACPSPEEPLAVEERSIPMQEPTVETEEIRIDINGASATEEERNLLREFGLPENFEEPPPSRRPHNHIGVYLTSSSVGRESKLEETLKKADEGISNAFVFDVKGSFVYFEVDSPMANELGLVRPLYDLPAVIQKAKDHGAYTIARFIAVKDPSLASLKPETQIQNIFTGKGIGKVWVNPGHETTLRYNEEIFREVIASGVDEVNFDYIRYPTEYAQKSIGLSGQEKADRIEAFLKMARRVVEELGTDTKIGISTYAILGWNFPVNFEPLGQDIARFSPLVDVISPMAYPSTFAAGAYYNPAKHRGSRMYYLVFRTLEGYKELLGEDSWKLRPWIQGYYVSTQNVYDQATAVYDAGLCGFTVWNAQNSYEPVYAALGRLTVPERCI